MSLRPENQENKMPCKIGDRIRLDFMLNDPDPIPVGTTGTVTNVSRGWQPNTVLLGVNWDIERSLGLIWPDDVFTVLEGETA